MRGRRSARVDLAGRNAGILTPEIEIAELSDEGYRRAVSVNVDGVVFGVRRLAQVMDGGCDRRHRLARGPRPGCRWTRSTR